MNKEAIKALENGRFAVVDDLFCLLFNGNLTHNLLSFQLCHSSSFLPNNQVLFPAVPPERQQDTLPLPNAAEPEWPHVSFGKTDVFFLLSVTRFCCSLFLPASAQPPGQGAWPGTCSCCYWLYASMP